MFYLFLQTLSIKRLYCSLLHSYGDRHRMVPRVLWNKPVDHVNRCARFYPIIGSPQNARMTLQG